MAKQQGEPAGSGEKQVDVFSVRVVLEVFTDEIADGLGIGDGLSGVGDRLVICTGSGNDRKQMVKRRVPRRGCRPGQQWSG